MEAEFFEQAKSTIGGLAAIYRPQIANNREAMAIYFGKVQDLDFFDLVATVGNFEGEKMPSPPELRRLVQSETAKRKTQEQAGMPMDQQEVWVCPACHNTGFAERITEKGNTAAQRCVRNGYHTLKDQVEVIEAENRTAMANAIFTLARQIYGEQMSEFDRWMFEIYGTTRLFELNLKQLASVRRGLFETASRPAEKSTQQAA